MSFWDEKYESTSVDERSWSQAVPGPSVHLILSSIESKDDPLIDIGSGASRLLDDLLELGFSDLSALDISQIALDELKERTGDRVKYVRTSILEWEPQRDYAIIHDRAVFHFFTEFQQQVTYKQVLLSALRSGGSLIIGTFGPEGPEQCSGLPVSRWSTTELSEFFSPELQLVDSQVELHQTPWESEQQFTWAVLKKVN